MLIVGRWPRVDITWQVKSPSERICKHVPPFNCTSEMNNIFLITRVYCISSTCFVYMCTSIRRRTVVILIANVTTKFEHLEMWTTLPSQLFHIIKILLANIYIYIIYTYICIYIYIYTYIGLFEMTDGVLTTCHTQYTWDRSICVFFLFNRTTLQVFVTYHIDALYVHPLWF